MRSVLAALRTLVLPYGATSGTRVILDGVNGRIEVYDAADQLITRVDGTGYHLYNGADEIAVLDALGFVLQNTSGAYLQLALQATFATLQMMPPAVAGHTFVPAALLATSDQVTGDAGLQIASPSIDGGAVARLNLYGANASLPLPEGGPIANLIADHVRHNGNAVNGALLRVAASPTASAGITAAAGETVVLTMSQITYKDGHGYELKLGNLASSSVASGRFRFRIRKGTVTGQVLADTGNVTGSPAAGNAIPCQFEAWFNVDGADVATPLVLTLQAVDGGSTATHQVISGIPRHFHVRDVGDKNQYAFGATLV